jgi:lipoic acid synthetase
MNSGQFSRKPDWLRTGLPSGRAFAETGRLLAGLDLNTVCRGARCPNMGECFGRRVAAFLIMGRSCTRACRFCNIGGKGRPEALDPEEPGRVAEAAARLGLKHAVVTSVTRDDLPDGGASHFAAAIRTLRECNPDITVEVLVPDFRGDEEALKRVFAERPEVFNHNVETVPSLYESVRPDADYEGSLRVLASAASQGLLVKSGLMLGLGETAGQVAATLQDLSHAGCKVVTAGQYLPPTGRHLPVERYVTPEEFEELARKGEQLGLVMHCGPLVRSSYNADAFLEADR